jgi:hypothetical protein
VTPGTASNICGSQGDPMGEKLKLKLKKKKE